MTKNKDEKEFKNDNESFIEKADETTEDNNNIDKEATFDNNDKDINKTEVEALKLEIETLNNQIHDLNNNYLRSVAEFDNLKKRTQKEQTQTFNNATAKTVKKFIDVLDNLQRALEFCKEDNEIKKGMEMTLEQFNKGLKALNVEEIDPLNQKFDPSLHNAVMHIEDETFENSTVCEVFQKGYKIGDSIIRFAMVKVAN
ncbi:MAG: nucleotide exchange factor GrpE [Oscillospiraceae bacterium]